MCWHSYFSLVSIVVLGNWLQLCIEVGDFHSTCSVSMKSKRWRLLILYNNDSSLDIWMEDNSFGIVGFWWMICRFSFLNSGVSSGLLNKSPWLCFEEICWRFILLDSSWWIRWWCFWSMSFCLFFAIYF